MAELNDGTYRALASQHSLGKSSTGKEQISVLFNLLDGMHIGVGLTWYGYFTDAALPVTLRALRACGWTGNDLTDIAGLDTNEVDLVVANEEYEGKTGPKVKWVNQRGVIQNSAPLPVNEAKAFAAKMKGAILALDKASGAPKPATVKAKAKGQEPPHSADGDMPPQF